jgi:hypothetical protein
MIRFMSEIQIDKSQFVVFTSLAASSSFFIRDGIFSLSNVEEEKNKPISSLFLLSVRRGKSAITKCQTEA